MKSTPLFLDSEHTTGFWDWDNKEKELYFTSTKVVEEIGAGTEQQVRRQVPGCTHAYLELTFNQAPDVAAFRRSCRRDRTLGPDVVTLRDIKDVVLFSVTTPLPIKVIDLMHTAQADRLLRAIIVYMQLYMQTSVELAAREELVTRDGACVVREPAYPPCVRAEGRMRADLALLRSVVGREYGSLLLGFGEMRRYHHMSNKLRRSTPEDDLRTYELFHQLATQIAWVALGRRAQTQPLVSVELGHLLRSAAFNMAEHRLPSGPMSDIKKAVLHGPPDPYGARRKLLVRSVATLDLIALDDYEVAGIGYLNVPYPSHRAEMLEMALTAPEETLAASDLVLSVGILGHPLSDYDDMMNLVTFIDDASDALSTRSKTRTLDPIRSTTQQSLLKGSKVTFKDNVESVDILCSSDTEEIGSHTPSRASGSSSHGASKTTSIVEPAASMESSRKSERPALLSHRKNTEMPTAKGPIPPPPHFPSRKSGISRGPSDLLEARSIWRRYNLRKNV